MEIIQPKSLCRVIAALMATLDSCKPTCTCTLSLHRVNGGVDTIVHDGGNEVMDNCRQRFSMLLI